MLLERVAVEHISGPERPPPIDAPPGSWRGSKVSAVLGPVHPRGGRLWRHAPEACLTATVTATQVGNGASSRTTLDRIGQLVRTSASMSEALSWHRSSGRTWLQTFRVIPTSA